MIPCAAAFTALSAPVNTPSNVEYTPEPWRRRNLFFGEVVLWSVRWGETLEQRLLKIQSGALRERPEAENCRAASRPATSTHQPTT